MKLEGKHVLVVGLGSSGLAAVDFLLGRGIEVSVSDGGAELGPAGEVAHGLRQRGVHCEFGGHSPGLFTSVDVILLSPGVPLELPELAVARRAGVKIIGELALAAAYLRTPVIAVTGTNGKSTVTTMIGEILQSAGNRVFVGGNLGTPLCRYLEGEQEADWVVLEVSSFQLDGAGEFRPHIGVLLNISPDHLDRYPDYQAYVASKWSLFAHQKEGDYAIVNGKDREIVRLLATEPPRAELYDFTLADRLDVLAGLTPPAGALSREPNRQNALASALAARLAGCGLGEINRGLTQFEALPHRLALVARVDGVDYYDDSKATNIGAVESALGGMTRPVVLIAGGLDKGGDYRLLLPMVGEKVKAMVLIGSAREKMEAAFAGTVPVVRADGLEQAVKAARKLAQPGDSVLLSPACASFDMFSGYAQRGEIFSSLVLKIKEAPGGEKAATAEATA